MHHLIIALCLCFLFIQCRDTSTETLSGNPSKSGGSQAEASSYDESISGLPIHFDSTFYLIHPIKDFTPSDPKKPRNKVYYPSESHEYSNVYSKSGYRVVGDLVNLVFQHLDSQQLTPLTDTPIKIQSFQFLQTLFESSQEQLLLYTVVESIGNEKEENVREIETLYISEINGDNFQRLSPDQQELLDWKLIAIKDRLYFTTLSYPNNNQILDEDERIHYYYVNLVDDDKKAIEYLPMAK